MPKRLDRVAIELRATCFGLIGLRMRLERGDRTALRWEQEFHFLRDELDLLLAEIAERGGKVGAD